MTFSGYSKGRAPLGPTGYFLKYANPSEWIEPCGDQILVLQDESMFVSSVEDVDRLLKETTDKGQIELLKEVRGKLEHGALNCEVS